NGCHGAEIENVTQEEGTLTVTGAYFHLEDAYCTQQVTYPFHMVKVDRHEGEVVFDMREEARQA
ncbi:MAG: hypothetical protein R3185_09555, partial [Candidatus Thermoplasmatota archaeon]|nr:hypothetical protein [Candidatus Thermoplasmatota archaeon]